MTEKPRNAVPRQISRGRNIKLDMHGRARWYDSEEASEFIICDYGKHSRQMALHPE